MGGIDKFGWMEKLNSLDQQRRKWSWSEEIGGGHRTRTGKGTQYEKRKKRSLNVGKKINERPSVGGVSCRSRNGSHFDP